MAIDKRSLEQQAADWLRDAIIDGRFTSGMKLTEIGLATEVGLSRSTVRSALQRLGADSLVVQRPYSGWEVAPLSPEDANELYTLRHCLEGMAAKLAARNIDELGKKALLSALKELKRVSLSNDRRAIAEADLNVHKTICMVANNKRLTAHLELLNQSILIYVMSTNLAMASPAKLIDEHQDLVDAIVSGDVERAELLAKEHVVNAEAYIIENLAKKAG
ncbi:GntR family transcriptional regulator [Pollutimonas subterranea]|uniref:GntR family transcriptional regulator n=1 Tax=Pollutimonas subterranea TaxID=2045210 RepID=A0A2N4U6T4_9BURK|nr:GntR family transcriptional regulator [Pollutimonas subterranea]PLC50736.1 GntR family transcriptional regulator [Pollutimonas subterranea]